MIYKANDVSLRKELPSGVMMTVLALKFLVALIY